MTVLYWGRPTQKRDGRGQWTDTGQTVPTRQHVSIDGARTACGHQVPAGAAVVVVTADWHEHATCYNCVYRLWPDHAPPGFVCPSNGSDFPLRHECPHSPGQGRDPAGCPDCTPALARASIPPPARPVPGPGQNPRPDVIRRWHIANPYDGLECAYCGELLERGELVNIEYEAGVAHAACSDSDATA